MATVINLRHGRDVLKESDVVRIDRATEWGNPFVNEACSPIPIADLSTCPAPQRPLRAETAIYTAPLQPNRARRGKH